MDAFGILSLINGLRVFLAWIDTFDATEFDPNYIDSL